MSKKKQSTPPTSDNASQPAETSKEKRPDSIRPAPPDAPLLSLPEAAAYLRMTPVALRALLEDENDDLSKQLRLWLVVLSERRRYIQREPFMAWLRAKCSTTNAQSGTTNIKLDK